VKTRGLIVAALYIATLATFMVTFAWSAPGLVLVGFVLMAAAGATYARGEQINARQMERQRRTGWRLQADITRLERELGIEESA